MAFSSPSSREPLRQREANVCETSNPSPSGTLNLNLNLPAAGRREPGWAKESLKHEQSPPFPQPLGAPHRCYPSLTGMGCEGRWIKGYVISGSQNAILRRSALPSPGVRTMQIGGAGGVMEAHGQHLSRDIVLLIRVCCDGCDHLQKNPDNAIDRGSLPTQAVKHLPITPD